MDNRKENGLTALELMITMAIVAILLATAFPALKNFSWNLRMKTAMDVLATDINLARSRAITHNIRTVICPATSDSGCSGKSEWQIGWMVFSDLNGDSHRQTTEPIHKLAGATELLSMQSSSSRNHLRFWPNGTAPGSNISILFCDKRGAKHAGKIIVSNTGRIRKETKGTGSTVNCP